eukprot:TRINITY_DN13530_c0_g1_i2.p1 TRINITY_DN13530_c0_g1~~TRINITY_DN13530_c0_g1_i2.p1  ORF type:complete len:142 (+),score=29.38 TRINITY_DN13530_c0_g1_i2:107-532(+)
MASIKFEDIFQVTNVDRAHFDKVSRIEASNDGTNEAEMELILDINSDVYPMHLNDKFTMALSTSLDGKADTGFYNPTIGPSLLDKYEYAMSGKVFKLMKEKASKISLYVSFGGLLMKLQGNQKNLQDFELDTHVYLLIRKV